nr:cysteine desulfurase family protein [Aerococcus urinae]
MSEIIYFDNSATTKIDPAALKSLVMTMENYYGNPSSLHDLGNQAKALLNKARQQIAELCGCQAEEIFFTSGGTESNNWALKGTAYEKAGRGKHIITSSVEHPSVSHTLKELEQEGFEVTYLPVDKEGRVNPKDLQTALRPDTILVSIMAVNNEIGTIQPIKEIAEILTDFPTIHFHVDGVQSLGRFKNPLIHSRVDLYSFSSHKFNGPRGVGILYKKKNRTLKNLVEGGGQEANLRSGTENLPGIVATAKAFRLSLERAQEENQRQEAIQALIRAYLKQYPDTIRIFSPESGASPHVLCFALKAVRGEVMVHALEEKGIYVSTTSACSSRQTGHSSSTLLAMGVDGSWAHSAIRLSFGFENTEEEAQRFIDTFEELRQKFTVIQ